MMHVLGLGVRRALPCAFLRAQVPQAPPLCAALRRTVSTSAAAAAQRPVVASSSAKGDALAPWLSACRVAVQRRQVLPPPHEEGSAAAENLALLGDALLKAAVLRELGCADRGCRLAKGELTDLASQAVRNVHLAACAPQALVASGVLSHADLAALMSDHARATAVEAAVGAVADMQPLPGASTADDAIRSLARALLSAAQGSPARPAKSHLLELGGRIASLRLGGPDHAPLWRATATLGTHSAVSECGNTRQAEADAAGAVLRAAGLTPEVELVEEELAPVEQPQSAESVLRLTPDDAAPWLARASGLASPALWLRRGLRSEPFATVMALPAAFPGQVAAVGCWSGGGAMPGGGEGHLAVLAVRQAETGRAQAPASVRLFCSSTPRISRAAAREDAATVAALGLGLIANFHNDV